MRKTVIAILLAVAAAFFFAPVIYGFHDDTPSWVHVTFYFSPSCDLFGVGAYYVYGQSLNGYGQPVVVSNYQWEWQSCGLIT